MIDLHENIATPAELAIALQDDYKARGAVAISDMRVNNPKGFIDLIGLVAGCYEPIQIRKALKGVDVTK